VTPYLSKAMRENNGLRVFNAAGWYDFATPFFGAEHALTRTGIPADRIDWHYYGAGHMMYVRETELSALSRDIRAFIRKR
jgi:carboxypeptidase C (cathepsin A)